MANDSTLVRDSRLSDLHVVGIFTSDSSADGSFAQLKPSRFEFLDALFVPNGARIKNSELVSSRGWRGFLDPSRNPCHLRLLKYVSGSHGWGAVHFNVQFSTPNSVVRQQATDS